MVTAQLRDRECSTAQIARAYWLGVALVVAGLFVTPLLPCVDYPQHLALSDVARRLSNPLAPEHAEYELNFFTYNGLFHWIVARLLSWLPIEAAGRLTVAASLVALAGAVARLFRQLQRPLEHAALFTPVLFSFALGWGFVNYTVAIAIAAWALVFVARGAMRPTLLDSAAIAGLGFACAYAHVLAMAALCVIATALALEVGWRYAPRSSSRASRLRSALFRSAAVLLPLSLGCLYCIVVYKRQFAWAPAMYRDPTLEGTAPPIWEKFVFFGAFASDLFGDATDQVILWVTLSVMAWSAIRRSKDLRALRPIVEPTPPIVGPFIVVTAAYFATPMVLVGTHLIFPRLGQLVVLGAALATPRFPPELAGRARRYILRLGVLAGANLLAHCAVYGLETRDASALLDDLPEGGAATALIADPGTIAFRNGTLTHLAAYYAARKHGRWAFAFARYLSVPVRFKEGSQPAWPRRGWEFSAEDYDPRCTYARAFPLVIVRAPDDSPRGASAEPWLRQMIFKGDAASVRLLAHRGEFWAFDTTGLPHDGTL